MFEFLLFEAFIKSLILINLKTAIYLLISELRRPRPEEMILNLKNQNNSLEEGEAETIIG